MMKNDDENGVSDLLFMHFHGLLLGFLGLLQWFNGLDLSSRNFFFVLKKDFHEFASFR